MKRSSTAATILHVSTTIDRGGHENHLKDLISRISSAGNYNLSVAYLKSRPYWQACFESLDIEVHDLGMRFFGDPRPAWKLNRLVSKLRPDIIHAHGSPAEIYCLSSKLRFNRPKLVISRHEERDRLFKHPAYPLIDAVLDKFTERFIAISHAVKRVDLARRETMTNKMSVVHYGLDADSEPHVANLSASATRKDLGISEGEVLFLTLARHVPEKDLPTMLRAFAKYLVKDQVPPAKLAMVGTGPLEADLQCFARELGISQNVIWTGFREDVPALLVACDVFLLSSIVEGFGLVLLEAMAASKPIIATHTSAIPEIVDHGKTGFLFPPGDHEVMAGQLAELAMSTQSREIMGKAGHLRLLNEFPIEKMVDATCRLYQDILR